VESSPAYTANSAPRKASFLRLAAQLLRLDKPVGALLLYWPCAWGVLLAASPARWDLLALLLLGAAAMRGAGCVVNDMLDRRIDAGVARTAMRPLASGALSLRAAWLILAGALGVGLLVWLALPAAARWLSLASVPIAALYPLAKRFFPCPQLVLALVFNIGVLVGWLATGQGLEPAAWLLYAGCIFWTLAYDTVYAWQDRADDARLGVYSSARLVAGAPKVWVGAGYALFALSWLFLGAWSAAALILAAAGGLLWWWDLTRPLEAGRFFAANAALGAALALLLMMR
jgi:4-hydroxybenzoate polyprenyltransferase